MRIRVGEVWDRLQQEWMGLNLNQLPIHQIPLPVAMETLSLKWIKAILPFKVKTITIFSQSDHSILSKPDSTHSSLIFRDDCDSFFNVSINKWTMLETLVIGNRCCPKTKSFEIRNCPQLKSIKVGNQSFKDSSCYIFGIEL